jgi:hypothetical protein
VAGKAFVDLEWAERQANMLRQDLGLNELDILDPYELAKKMEFIELLPLDAIQNIPPEFIEQLRERDSSGWSAGSLALPDGRVAVIMNPKHPKTRARATLMEEIVHIHLAHRPSLLTVGVDNITTRTYDDQQEREAYWVGAAALVPMWQLKKAQKLRLNIQQLADYCEVSKQLVKFRSDITDIRLAQSPN